MLALVVFLLLLSVPLWCLFLIKLLAFCDIVIRVAVVGATLSFALGLVGKQG